MGRATVLSGGAEGLYTVRLDYGKAERDARVAKMDARVVELTGQIAEMEVELMPFEAQVEEARLAARDAINEYALAMQTDPQNPQNKALADHVNAVMAELYEREKKLMILQGPIDLLKAEQAQLQADRTALLAVQVEEVRQVWCADYTERAAGEVATLEVPGEPQALVLAPGGRWPGAGDGGLRARALMSPAQAYYNAAMLPGWQRWMPTYRAATLLAVDVEADVADVRLDDAVSSAAGLGVMLGARDLSAVPVRYMTCNAKAFQPGDRVVVQFVERDWARPEVVGFLSNPRRCEVWPDLMQIEIRQSTNTPRPFVTVRNGAGGGTVGNADGYVTTLVPFACGDPANFNESFALINNSMSYRVFFFLGESSSGDYVCDAYPLSGGGSYEGTADPGKVTNFLAQAFGVQEFDYSFDDHGHLFYFSDAGNRYVAYQEYAFRAWRDYSCPAMNEVLAIFGDGVIRGGRVTADEYRRRTGMADELMVRNTITGALKSYRVDGVEFVEDDANKVRFNYLPVEE